MLSVHTRSASLEQAGCLPVKPAKLIQSAWLMLRATCPIRAEARRAVLVQDRARERGQRVPGAAAGGAQGGLHLPRVRRHGRPAPPQSQGARVSRRCTDPRLRVYAPMRALYSIRSTFCPALLDYTPTAAASSPLFQAYDRLALLAVAGPKCTSDTPKLTLGDPGSGRVARRGTWRGMWRTAQTWCCTWATSATRTAMGLCGTPSWRRSSRPPSGSPTWSPSVRVLQPKNLSDVSESPPVTRRRLAVAGTGSKHGELRRAGKRGIKWVTGLLRHPAWLVHEPPGGACDWTASREDVWCSRHSMSSPLFHLDSCPFIPAMDRKHPLSIWNRAVDHRK